MNKRAYIFCLSVLICGFIVAYAAGVKMGRAGNEADDNNKDKVVNVNPQKDTDILSTEGYWVKAVNNKIIVYKDDGTTMVAETDIDISEFSNSEKSILESGIYLESAEELFKYLESGTS